MCGANTRSSSKAIEAACPEHDIQSIKLNGYSNNKKKISKHRPIEHFKPEGYNGVSWIDEKGYRI